MFEESKIDWRSRIQEQCKSLGFGSLAELLEFHPNEPYSRLGERLTTPPINIYIMQFEEAKNIGTVRDAVKDCFVRHVNRAFPNGWDNSHEAEFRRAGAVADPVAHAETIARLSALTPQIEAVSDYLFTMKIPEGWLPKNIEDPIIEEAFDNCWPIKDV